ncbi:N-acetylglucosamine-1-phosphodiester alpha-N-acetylglucosaminidase isoform X1 [Pristis pectinata]|uniref:N-acetylglucosamine-1-phosphodiester alpha-N-acetylglucosaminidase isoform X1 n=1 Tax=Pristis pectinata TaxID=685728 RepID=UPI00223CACE5|nr:N-acetylglucosamine-1-phosphodiester alpha-N-acetylglucosaminidase isoform X1 [Pristis pectinata]
MASRDPGGMGMAAGGSRSVWSRSPPGKGCWRTGLALGVLSLFCTGGGVTDGPYLNELFPYYPLEHGSRNTHRYIRDCQPIAFGNITHETWPADKSTDLPIAKSTVFVSKFPTDEGKLKTVTGHFTFVNNPLKTVSVLEPREPGGCSHSYRATVQETAKSRKCLVAHNGGFFDMDKGRCFGNVVSDGKLVQNGNGIQNAQFGIKKDGTLVFGYLSEEEVLDQENPFVQLVSGVVWLLRNGTIYINESQSAECSETQKTGSFEKFINVVSARNAVGHDKYGRLILFHVDGQTDDRGLNLWEVATFLKSQGIINAINLDGGGSATLIFNGSLASYPSDHCLSDPMWRCPRAVSTVICVHEPECVPADCSGHGDCLLGDCHCTGFWSGASCNLLNCGPLNCTIHGICSEDGCRCNAGWMGTNCTDVCHLGFYGDGCSQKCHCMNGGTCDPVHGACTCQPGYHGEFCEQECPRGWYGLKCQHSCHCPNTCPCHPVTGSCNITHGSGFNDDLYRVHQCLASQTSNIWKNQHGFGEDSHLFKEKTWLIISLTLLILLLLSTAGNLFQFCQRSVCPGFYSEYSYQRLNESNGLTCVDVPEIIPLKQNDVSFEEDIRNSETINF